MYPILAIDYGTKRLGIAVSDSKGLVSTPLRTLQITKNRDILDLIEEIRTIIEEYRIKTILVGKPQEFSEEYKANTDRINTFANTLRKRITLDIVFYDESYSTSSAKDMIISKGQHFKSKKEDIDSFAASIFLQEYLDNQKKNV